MRIVAITPGEPFATEAEAIRMLLGEGVWRVHLRLPAAAEGDVRRLIEALPPELYPRLSLHDRFNLAVEYGIGGVHLNGRNPAPPAGFGGVVSRSCHSLEELAGRTAEEYLFLSPVYDSISKQGYGAAFTRQELEAAGAAGVIGARTVALGGVTPERLPELAAWGFGGAALLGYLWGDRSLAAIRERMRRLKSIAKSSG